MVYYLVGLLCVLGLITYIVLRLAQRDVRGPANFRVRLVREERNVAMALVYQADLQPVLDAEVGNPVPDLDHRVMEVLVDGTPEHQFDNVPKDAAMSPEFKVPQNTQVEVRLYNVDDAGNRSAGYASQTFSAVDTIPPDAPGSFGQITLLREED